MQSARYTCHILLKVEFSQELFEKWSTSNITQIHPMEAQLFHVDGQARWS
jgi:hypothetical protein